MEWSQHIDGYCERVDPTFWSEPINAVTNLAFIIAAIVMWRRTTNMPSARILCGILFAIGIGSFLFHTFATTWAALTDTAPIGLFILFYLYFVNLNVMRWPRWLTLLSVAAFIPYAALITSILGRIPFFEISSFYWTVPILLFIYGYFLRGIRPQVSRGFVLGGLLLSLSITARSLDEIWCAAIPFGTHFLWHCLNAVMLGYMIHVYASHILAGRAVQR